MDTENFIVGEHHPGVLLQSLINRKDIKQRTLAKRIGVDVTVLNQIIKGKRDINVSIAIKLEPEFKYDALQWLSYQNRFDINKMRVILEGQK